MRGLHLAHKSSNKPQRDSNGITATGEVRRVRWFRNGRSPLKGTSLPLQTPRSKPMGNGRSYPDAKPRIVRTEEATK